MSFSLLVVFCSVALHQLALSRPIGGVYQINNNRDFNGVIVWSIAADGSLSYVKQVPTGGAGSGPLSAAGTDPLGSQSTVAIDGTSLFVVNANSSTITYFEIDERDATVLNFIATAPTLGQFPVSVTAADGRVCALTGGVNNGIRCWSFDEQEGLQLLSWDRSLESYSQIIANPPTARPALSQVAFSPRGDALVVTIRGVGGRGQVLVYPISHGNLAQQPQVILPTGAVATFGFAFLGTENVLVATDPQRPAGVDVVSFNPRTGSSEYAAFQTYSFGADPLPAAPCWAAYSPLSETVLAFDASATAGRVTLLSVNPSTFAVSAIASVNVNKGSFEAGYIPLNPRSEVWYVNTPGNGASLSSFTLSKERNGQLSAVYRGAYTAPSSANIGPQNHGVATFLHGRRGRRD